MPGLFQPNHDWVSGSLYMRPNSIQRGNAIGGHKHNFDHTHITQAGWFLIRGTLPNGSEVIVQKCSAEYPTLRSMKIKYEPETVLKPIRFADYSVKDMKNFNIQFVGLNDPIPEGGEEIIFNPSGYHVCIHADVLHEIYALDDGHGDCIYSHRTPQGDVSTTYTGWEKAYV